jgi:hypothetical protein
MRNLKLISVICCIALFAVAGITMAQQMPNPYGPNINLATAKKVAAAAAEEAAKLKINVVIAIVDTGSHIVYLERFDVVQWGSLDVALHKAKCSIMYKRPTKALEVACRLYRMVRSSALLVFRAALRLRTVRLLKPAPPW